jgi:hypothetical protein
LVSKTRQTLINQQVRNIIINFIVNDDDLDNIIMNNVLPLLEPLEMGNEQGRRQNVPRRMNIFLSKQFLGMDMDSLFVEHFRMSRAAFEVNMIYLYIFFLIQEIIILANRR